MGMLPGWNPANRIKIFISSTYIDADLTHFPIPIFIGASVGVDGQDLTAIFDELGDQWQKIAVTKSDGTTEIYAEVVRWDSETEIAVIHVSKSDLVISSSGPTELYIYYDSAHADNTTYIGWSGDSAAENVWDANFNAVYNFSERKQLRDIRPDRVLYWQNTGIGAIGLMSNGNLIQISAMAYGVGTGGVYKQISTDKGETWSEYTLIKSASGESWQPVGTEVIVTNTGRVIAFYQRYTTALTDCDMYYLYSDDDGDTWEGEAEINVGEAYVTCAVQSVIQIQNGDDAGRIVLGISYYDGFYSPYNRFHSIFAYSDDDGDTWSTGGTIEFASKVGAYEPCPVELSDGTLWCSLRTAEGTLYYSTSADGAETWAAAADTGIVAPNGQAFCYRLSFTPNEIVLLHNNSAANRYPLVARLSTDDCSSFGNARDYLSDSHNQNAIWMCPVDDNALDYLLAVWDNRGASLNEGFGVIVSRQWFENMLVDSTGNNVDAVSENTDWNKCIFKGGTATALSTYSTYTPDKAFNDTFGTAGADRWIDQNAITGDWLKYDLGAGITKALKRVLMNCYPGQHIKDFKIQGSNNDSSWTDLGSYTGEDIGAAGGTQTFYIASPDYYRYYRFILTSNPWNANLGIIEINGYEDTQQTNTDVALPAQGFDGSGGYINIGSDKFEADSQGTIEAYIKRNIASRDLDTIFSASVAGATNLFQFQVVEASSFHLTIQEYASPGSHNRVHGNTALGITTHHVAVTSNGTAWALYVDGVAEALTVANGVNNGNWFADLAAGVHVDRIGQLSYGAGPTIYNFSGDIYTLRISSTPRSAAWLKATNYGLSDSLLTFEFGVQRGWTWCK